jgi:hypothetical protein
LVLTSTARRTGPVKLDTGGQKAAWGKGLLSGGREGTASSHFLAETECAALIAASEQVGYGCARFDTEYRGNLRLMTKDPGLSAAIWKRLQPLVRSDCISFGIFAFSGTRLLDANHQYKLSCLSTS